MKWERVRGTVCPGWILDEDTSYRIERIRTEPECMFALYIRQDFVRSFDSPGEAKQHGKEVLIVERAEARQRERESNPEWMDSHEPHFNFEKAS